MSRLRIRNTPVRVRPTPNGIWLTVGPDLGRFGGALRSVVLHLTLSKMRPRRFLRTCRDSDGSWVALGLQIFVYKSTFHCLLRLSMIPSRKSLLIRTSGQWDPNRTPWNQKSPRLLVISPAACTIRRFIAHFRLGAFSSPDF